MKNNNPISPRLAKRFLLWFLKDSLAEEVIGDLEEQFVSNPNEKSRLQANINYWIQTFNHLRPFAIKNYKSNYSIMLNHYFKVSFRNLLKYHYRINISLEVFVMTGAGVLLLTIATVCFQAIKLVIMNPVKSLKSE